MLELVLIITAFHDRGTLLLLATERLLIKLFLDFTLELGRQFLMSFFFFFSL